MDLEWERWMAMGDDAAHALATRIAGRVGAASVELRQHDYAGRHSRVALFDMHGVQFALVPGGRVQVGYDVARLTPTPDQLESYRHSAEAFGLPDDIYEHVGECTS